MTTRITNTYFFLNLLRQTNAWDKFIIAVISTAVGPTLDQASIIDDERCDRSVRMLHEASTDHIGAVPDTVTHLRVGIQKNTRGFETATSEDAYVERYTPLSAVKRPYNDFSYAVSVWVQPDVDDIRVN